MRCCIASSTTSRLKDYNSGPPLPPPTGQPSAAYSPSNSGNQGPTLGTRLALSR